MDGYAFYGIVGLTSVVGMAMTIFGVRRVVVQYHLRETRRAMREFRLRREQLEAKFYDLARLSGKPKGLRWIDCEWQNTVRFARQIETNLLTAFVGVNIRFDAIEGEGMEDVAAVGTIRDACAVFHYRAGRWGTGGRALFNMNPQEAVDKLHDQFIAVNVEPTALV
ncbi:MAG: hypothetical protein O2955_03480 [Planctomycetota bacterium]|nr:hypothetical protein [Planctomycetota bacterium]MDA1211550.1 hypothetical protein [Planctomycetota bacterium]